MRAERIGWNDAESVTDVRTTLGESFDGRAEEKGGSSPDSA